MGSANQRQPTWRERYGARLEEAHATRDQLRALLALGLPALHPTTTRNHAGIARLINAHMDANQRLRVAAQIVCASEGLANDGESEGIIWEVSL